MPKFAANLTMMFNEFAFEDRFAAAAEAGFEGVEFLFPYAFEPDLLAGKLAEAGLQQALFNMPPGDWDAGDRGMASIPSRRSEFRENVDIALTYAQALNCPTLHTMSGLIDDNTDPDVALNCCIDNLQYAADKCAGHGITVVIEPLNGRDVPGYFCRILIRRVKLLSWRSGPIWPCSSTSIICRLQKAIWKRDAGRLPTLPVISRLPVFRRAMSPIPARSITLIYLMSLIRPDTKDGLDVNIILPTEPSPGWAGCITGRKDKHNVCDFGMYCR